MVRRIVAAVVICAGCLSCLVAQEGGEVPKPLPYQIVLRSRSGDAVPEHNRDGIAGGGSVDVLQRSPDTLLAIMRGAVVAGSEQHCPGMASIHFALKQNFEIVANRPGLRPPLLALSGQLVGALQSSQPEGGRGDQGPACASILSGGEALLKFCINPHSVISCQNLFVNDREGAYEVVIVPGNYCLHQVFEISASAPPPSHHICPKVVPAASVIFDPEPKLETRWNYVLQTFRGVPRGEFGFSVLVRVTESSPAPAAPGGVETLPAPMAK